MRDTASTLVWPPVSFRRRPDSGSPSGPTAPSLSIRSILLALSIFPRPSAAIAACVTRLAFVALLCAAAGDVRAQQPLTIPAPRGMLSDFAGVVTAEWAQQIEALAQFVRAKGGGEIAVVTLPDLAGRDVAEVALQIGREWKVGANAGVGDARRNAGVVVLVVPKESSADGRGYINIQTGQGVEGSIRDAVAGNIRREAVPYIQQADYGRALLLITRRISERYAAEFGFSLDSAGVPRAGRSRNARGTPKGVSPILALIVFVGLVLLSGRRGRGGRGGGGGGGGGARSGLAGFILGQLIGQALGGRGGGFGGGGGGGGFGGFGGGGGFSGGGSSGSW